MVENYYLMLVFVLNFFVLICNNFLFLAFCILYSSLTLILTGCFCFLYVNISLFVLDVKCIFILYLTFTIIFLA